MRSIRTLVESPPAGDRRLPRAHGRHDAGRRARHQPVPRRAGRADRGRAGKVAATVATKYQAPRGTFDVLPADARARRAVERPPPTIFARAGYEPIATPAFEDTELFERGVGRLHRHRPQGDVHLRGQGRAQRHPAAGGDGADLPRLRRARHAQAGAAGEALLLRARSSATSARRPAATASSTRSAPRRSAPTRRSPTPRRSCCSTTLLARAGRAGRRAAARQPRLAGGARAPTWRS